jgi:hypothetical protein
LHAEELRFQHPETEAWTAFAAPVPPDMAGLLTRLRQAFAPEVPV